MARVLVIDDDPLVRKALAALLADRYDYVLAASTVEGIEHAESARFDVALVDMNMPGLNGLEAVKGLRHIKPPIPIIAMSGGSQTQSPEDYAVLAVRMGAYAFLGKPFTRETLFATIERALSGAA